MNQSNGEILKKPSIQIPAFSPFNGKCYRIYSIRVPRKINLKWVKELAKFVNTPFKVSDLSLELDYLDNQALQPSIFSALVSNTL